MLAGRTYLITGGTGSFGQSMVDRLLRADAGEIRVFSRDEAKQEAMRVRLRDDRVRFYIGDVRDFDSVSRALRGVEYVFHAAALKQVPSCEFFPVEAVRTNVLGSANVVEACDRNDVARLVLLSTDKAVHPVNAMGMTKALMEKVAQAHARGNPGSRTIVACVRYGNVMYSRGSVIPLFAEQIRRDEPLTVTDPAMTRFLMSLTDSVRLVEHAFVHAEPGDVLIHKANACTVDDLATAMCELFGVARKVRALGIRHGEKMHETLASREELSRAEDHGDYFRVRIDSRDLNYALYFDEGDLSHDPTADFTSENAPRLDVAGVVAALRQLPELRTVVGLPSGDELVPA